MLATMAAAIEYLRPTQSKSEGQRDRAELQLIRDGLVRDRVAITGRGKNLRSPVARQLSKQRVKQIERQLKRIDAEIRKRLKAEEALERQSEILTSIPGIAEDHREAARHLLAPRIERYAPDLLPVECANVIWNKARRREIASATPILAGIAKLSEVVRIQPGETLLRHATETALLIGHPVYDSL